MTTIRQQIEQRKSGELITSIMPVEFKELVIVLLNKSTDISALWQTNSEHATRSQCKEAKKLLCLANLIGSSPDSFQLLLQGNWKELYFRAVDKGEMVAEMRCDR